MRPFGAFVISGGSSTMSDEIVERLRARGFEVTRPAEGA
jgi:hypothetical protein